MDSIELFVLLDLLGAAKPNVPSYFRTTHWAYQHLAELERRLRALQFFQSSPNHPSKKEKKKTNQKRKEEEEPVFLPDTHRFDSTGRNGQFHPIGTIQDDHIPFMSRGVEILHLITYPFPRVWHEMADDGDHLHLDTVHDWALLVTAFVTEWMDLEGFFDTRTTASQTGSPGIVSSPSSSSSIATPPEKAGGDGGDGGNDATDDDGNDEDGGNDGGSIRKTNEKRAEDNWRREESIPSLSSSSSTSSASSSSSSSSLLSSSSSSSCYAKETITIISKTEL